MARGTGTANLAASLEVLAGAPLDARTVVPTVEDLTLSSNFPYKYVGLPVVVQATGDLYILTGNDVTVAANWKKVGDGGSSGGSDNVVEGYYNTTDHLFYEDSSYTTLITGASEVIYVALDTNKTYRYNGLLFVRLDEESGGGGGGGHTIVNESGTEMAQEDKLQFTSGLRVTDDDENLSTKVEADLMQAVDMSEIIPTLPGVMARSIYNNRFNRSDLYSTDEVLIGKWIDGKPLYQKVVTVASATNWNTIYTLEGADYIEIANARYYYGGNGVEWIKLNYTQGNDRLLLATDGNKIVMAMQGFTSGSNNPVNMVLQYTKTTDGVSNVDFDTDYSTDETIIGKWIDGSPIYQKTFNVGALTNTSTKEVQHEITNMDICINAYGVAVNPSTHICKFFGNVGTGGTNSSIGLAVDRSKISMRTYQNDTAYTYCYVTLKYTKTTD